MKLDFRQTVPIWWGFTWRTALYGALAVLLFRICAYVGSVVWSTDIRKGMYLASIAAAISYFPLALLALKQGLSRQSRPGRE